MTAPARRVVGVAALVALLATGLVHAAAAQELPGEPAARLVVTGIDGAVGPGTTPGEDGQDPDEDEEDPHDLDLRVLVENIGSVDVQALQVVVEVHTAVGGARSVLQQTLDGGPIERPLQTLPLRVDVRDGGSVAPGQIASLALSVPGDDIGWVGTNDVYPVQVTLLLGSQVLDRVVTSVVHLHDPPDRPLQTTAVWPIDAPTRRTPGGAYTEALPAELEPGGRIDVLLTAAEAHGDAPLLLAPGVTLVEELADRANGFRLVDGTEVAAEAEAAQQAADLLERLRSLVEDAPLDPVTGPYGHAHVAALAAGPAEVAPLAEAAMSMARNRIQALLGRAPDLGLHLATTPITEDVLDLVAAERLLVDWNQVVGPDLANFPDLPQARRRLPAVSGPGVARQLTVADPHVEAILTSPPVDGGTSIARQRLVAETGLLYLIEPGREDRALLIMPPSDWNPAPGTADLFLDALTSSPWMELSRPVADGPTDRAELATEQAIMPDQLAEDVGSTLRRLTALREAVSSGSSALTETTIADLEDAVVRALTPRAVDDRGEPAREQVRAIHAIAEEAFGGVELADGGRVTLTSDTGEVPVTVERTGGGPIDLVVEVRSSNALRWADGVRRQEITLPAGASRTVSFGTRALSRGTFPVTITVTDPTGDKLLDVTTLSVRSTAISRTALIVIGSVVVLLLLGGLRRRRSPRLRVVP